MLTVYVLVFATSRLQVLIFSLVGSVFKLVATFVTSYGMPLVPAMSRKMSDNSSFEAIICRIHTDLFDDYDHWIISRLEQVTSDIEKCFRDREIAPLTHLVIPFSGEIFCDWYLEASKGKLRSDQCLE